MADDLTEKIEAGLANFDHTDAAWSEQMLQKTLQRLRLCSNNIQLTDALLIARGALAQLNGLDMLIAGNGPTVGQVIDRALKGETP